MTWRRSSGVSSVKSLCRSTSASVATMRSALSPSGSASSGAPVHAAGHRQRLLVVVGDLRRVRVVRRRRTRLDDGRVGRPFLLEEVPVVQRVERREVLGPRHQRHPSGHAKVHRVERVEQRRGADERHDAARADVHARWRGESDRSPPGDRGPRCRSVVVQRGGHARLSGLAADHLADGGPRHLQVVVVLQHGARGSRPPPRVQAVDAQERQRVRPVDRLGDAGALGDLHLAQPGHGAGDLLRQGGGDLAARARR